MGNAERYRLRVFFLGQRSRCLQQFREEPLYGREVRVREENPVHVVFLERVVDDPDVHVEVEQVTRIQRVGEPNDICPEMLADFPEESSETGEAENRKGMLASAQLPHARPILTRWQVFAFHFG